jgi:hypothetical protein
VAAPSSEQVADRRADHSKSKSSPVVVVLAASWARRGEDHWAVRQVAGALACTADVHVITLEGSRPGQRTDGVFTVHELASALDPRTELCRNLLITALISVAGDLLPAIDSDQWQSDHKELGTLHGLLAGGLVDAWEPAPDVFHALDPDLVVLTDHRDIGALSAFDNARLEVPVVLVPRVTDPQSAAFPLFEPVFERADRVLAFTETEKRAVATENEGGGQIHGRSGHDWVQVVGLPMSTTPSVLREPPAHLCDDCRDAGGGFVLVTTGRPTDSENAETQLARLVRLCFPTVTVAVLADDGLEISRRGRREHHLPVERGSDLVRLIAWAKTVVDLRPGSLYARRSIEALLYGVPVVVPAGSRAQEHAEHGGLWFESPGEIVWCVESMLDSGVRASFGEQGRRYAESRYGSTDDFIDRVLSATGLSGK